jgi:acetylornithine deacetylase
MSTAHRTNVDAAVAAALETLQANEELLYDEIAQLVRIPSVIGDEAAAQEHIAGRYRAMGLEVASFDADPAVEQHPLYCDAGLPPEGRPNLVARLDGAGGGRSLALNGHVDVVSPEPVASWTRDPWGAEREGDRLYGRGAADMKAGLVANHVALRSVMEAGIELEGDVLLQSVVEEESGGGHGTLATLLAGHVADALFVPEPLDQKIIIAHPGINYFRVRIVGRTAHAARTQDGVNAIGKMLPIYQALEELEVERWDRYVDPFWARWGGRAVNLNRGRMEAGDWGSTVAGHAILDCRVSFVPPQDEASLRQEIEERIAAVAAADPWLRDHPPEVEWFGWRTDPWIEDPEEPFIQDLESVLRRQGLPVDRMASAAGLDNRFGPVFGMQSVCYGPSGKEWHGIDEYVELPSVLQVTRVITELTVRWCGVRA